MLRAIGSKDGKPVVILGLERENVRRLINGEPIQVNLRNIGEGQITDLPDIDIFIVFATEEVKQKFSEVYVRGVIDGMEEGLNETD